jgi:hypothetical protein
METQNHTDSFAWNCTENVWGAPINVSMNTVSMPTATPGLRATISLFYQSIYQEIIKSVQANLTEPLVAIRDLNSEWCAADSNLTSSTLKLCIILGVCIIPIVALWLAAYCMLYRDASIAAAELMIERLQQLDKKAEDDAEEKSVEDNEEHAWSWDFVLKKKRPVPCCTDSNDPWSHAWWSYKTSVDSTTVVFMDYESEESEEEEEEEEHTPPPVFLEFTREQRRKAKKEQKRALRWLEKEKAKENKRGHVRAKTEMTQGRRRKKKLY